MLKRAMWLAALLVGSATAGALADELSVGDPAPKLGVKEFVKGEPITKLEKGKTYVVEFWATWCGPCRVSIPHLTEMQKKFADQGVVFVGVSDEPADTVKPFVEKMGDKMEYVVAIDPARKTHEGYMKAFGVGGIPHAISIWRFRRPRWPTRRRQEKTLQLRIRTLAPSSTPAKRPTQSRCRNKPLMRARTRRCVRSSNKLLKDTRRRPVRSRFARRQIE